MGLIDNIFDKIQLAMKKTTFIFSLLSTSLFFAQGKCPFNFDSKPTNTPTASVQETQPMVEQNTSTQTMNVSKPITPNTNNESTSRFP